MKHRFKSIFLITILCCIVSLCTAGCKTRYWTINHSIEEITQIFVIVENQDGEDTIITLEKQYYEECVSDILQLEAHKYFPSPTNPKGSAFKIVFNTGEYDLISLWEPQHWILNENGVVDCNSISWLCFDNEQFNRLINKWCDYGN